MNTLLINATNFAGLIAPYLFGVVVLINIVMRLLVNRPVAKGGLNVSPKKPATFGVNRDHLITFLEYLSNRDMPVSRRENAVSNHPNR
jgi:hypothetical protein